MKAIGKISMAALSFLCVACSQKGNYPGATRIEWTDFPEQRTFISWNFRYKCFLHIVMKYFVCLTAFVLFSCSEHVKQPEAIFQHEGCMELQREAVKLSSVFPDCRLIPLETNDSSLIGGVGNKVVQRDSMFYVASENSVLCFDDDGSFVRRIDRRGEGPEDYVEIADFDVIVSADGRKELWISGVNGIKVYDVSSGDYVKSIPVGVYVHQFKYVDANTLLVISSDDRIFHVCDSTGAVRRSFMEKDLANSVHKYNQFFTWQNKVGYQLGDTQTAIVYDVQTDSCSLQPILPAADGVLTPEVSRAYYDKYGYEEQYPRLMKDYTLLSTVRMLDKGAAFVWMAPEKNYLLTLLSPSGCRTYPFSRIDNDVCATAGTRFLATLICCESDRKSVLLFQIPAESRSEDGLDEDNFWLLEASLGDGGQAGVFW